MHYADKRTEVAAARVAQEVAAFLSQRGIAEVTVEPTAPTVEDSFMARMGAPSANAA
jgi:hypothetical protein